MTHPQPSLQSGYPRPVWGSPAHICLPSIPPFLHPSITRLFPCRLLPPVLIPPLCRAHSLIFPRSRRARSRARSRAAAERTSRRRAPPAEVRRHQQVGSVDGRRLFQSCSVETGSRGDCSWRAQWQLRLAASGRFTAAVAISKVVRGDLDFFRRSCLKEKSGGLLFVFSVFNCCLKSTWL